MMWFAVDRYVTVLTGESSLDLPEVAECMQQKIVCC